MIFTERQVTVRKGKATIDEPVILYRGDFEVSIKFTIMESKFRFKSGVNLVDSEKASYGQLAILAPYGGNVFSEVVKCEDGTVTFTLTKEMIDQLEEVGLYSFQIRLFDYYRESRVSIPPVEFGIEVREPVASEDHNNEVNNAIVGYSIAKVVDPSKENVGDTFDANGNYNKTDWETGDRITEGKLNKIEDAIYKVNQNEKNDVAALDKRITSNFNVLDTNKADKNEIFSMKNMGQDVREAMTGGSVAVVGKNCIGNENIITNSIGNDKLELKTEAFLNEFCKYVDLTQKQLDFDFEYGVILPDGSFSEDDHGGAIALNNIRTKEIYRVSSLTINLLVDNIMFKVVHYDNAGNYIDATSWMSRNKTTWTNGGISSYTIKSSNVVLCFADTVLNNTGWFTVSVDELKSRFNLIGLSPLDCIIDKSYIKPNSLDLTVIKPNSLDLTVFEESIANDISKNAVILDGVMKLPNEFGELPFDIIRENNRYNISLSDKQLNLNPVIIYVSSASTSTGLGLDKENPITLRQVKQNLTSNLYTSQNIKILFTENLYFMDGISDFDLIGLGQNNTVTNITIESGCGFTWIGYGNRNITWEKHNDKLYKYYCEKKVSDLVDLENLKSNGMPDLYIKKSSISEVIKEGEFCQFDNMIYVYPRFTNDINKINIIFGFDYTTSVLRPGILTIRKESRGNVIFKNIGTLLDSLNMRDLRSLDIWYYFFNCRFHRDSMDSFALNGKYKAVLIDCIADYGSKDNFNYHSTSKDSVAIELNCKSYGAGEYKLDTIGVNATKDSCNGSTAHDGMCVARFGCSYWDCEGSVVADVNNCVTYCVECSVKNILSTISNSNYKAAFMMHDNRYAGSNPLRPEYNHTNYLISCQGGGDNVTWGVRSEGVKINISGFKGNRAYYQEKAHDINNINSIQ